ncbi:MAG: S49 family peptidase [Aphanocapsa sp. GSE-SYN-MK-11-07L]|jgi:protease-4|nr:S49 family peptidase [Aphanocapsa sp. GSE-SYN-MK-11-07L]
MSKPLLPFWPNTLRRFGNIFFGTVSVVVSLTVVSVGFSILGGILTLVSGGADDIDRYRFVAGKQGSRNRLLQISVRGPILGSPIAEGSSFGLASLAGITYGYQVQTELEKAAKDSSVKGIFLHVTTPGGTIFGSQAIYDGIKAYRQKTGKPVIAFVEGLAASGGVWAIVGADKIYADYGSLVGSIGVLGPTLQFYDKPIAVSGGLFGGGVTTQNGIEQTIISAGRGKDLGNPFRRPTAAELQSLKSGIESEYKIFVDHVAKARKIKPEVIRNQMGAMIFDNQAAQKFGLIDGTLGRSAALATLANQANLGENFQLVRTRPETTSLLSQLLGAQLPQPTETQTKVAQAQIAQEVCAMTQQRSLVYYGDVRELCR